MIITPWKTKKEYEVIQQIKNLKIQGSKAVAQNAINILYHIAKKEGFNQRFFDMADFLQNLRPTQVLTYNLIEYVKHKKDLAAFSKINKFFEKSTEKINENGLKILEGNEIIMTHCHSSEELNVLKYAHSLGYDFEVYVTETRPRMQGIKSAKELLAEGIKVKYIVDDAAGFFMDEVDVLLVGIDAIKKEGVWNKIGTYMMALAAKHHNKDVWFIGNILKTDLRPKNYVEFRNPAEIINPKEIEGAEILNPAFDLTPWELIDGIVSDIGLHHKWEEIEKINLYEVLEKY